MANDYLRDCLGRLVRRRDLTQSDAASLLDALLDDASTDGQIGAVLTALAAKGETVAELAGMASALRARAVRIVCPYKIFIDTAGTGSSAAKTFNVSTAAAFVIAGAGLPVAKHGNRAASSRSGSADVLTVLGVNISVAANISERCLNEIGICFMFAPIYHGTTARVAGVRRELGIHTTFNILGPLSNPAGAPRQIIGVWRVDLAERLAKVLALLGTERAWVVHGEDGLDEITVAGKTFVAEAHNGKVRTFQLRPADFGLSLGSLDHLRGGEAQVNAQLILDVLSGARHDEARALVVANAAAALLVGGRSESLIDAARRAEQSIDTGAAMEKLEQLVRATID